MKGWSAHTIHPSHLGHDGTGFMAAAPGRAKGLTVAIGCWWEDKSSSAVCVFDEEASFRPVEKHLLQLAQIAVPKFLG